MKIKRYLIFVILITIVSAIYYRPVFAQNKEVLTNSIVVKLVKADLGETVIINKIRTSKTKFNLSTNSLIRLKKSGVSNNIINAMVKTLNPQQESGISGNVFLVQNGKLMEIDYVAGFIKNMTSPFSFYETGALIAKGKDAQLRIANKNPIFYTRSNPSGIDVVKFDVDVYKGKPARYVMGALTTGSTIMNIKEKYTIEFTYKKTKNSLYKVTLKKPLTEGNYGIIVSEGSSRHKIYDFDVGKL